MKNKWAKKVKEVRWDANGWYIICKVALGEHSCCTVNIYVPNIDTPSFFNEIFLQISELDCVQTIIGGDYNVVLEPKLDRNSDVIYNGQSRERILQEMSDKNLVDPWRTQYPDKRMFTWMRGINREEWARLDYFLVSANVLQQCKNSEIYPTIVSDHSMVTLDIDVSMQKCGPGCWKFNNELLGDEKFCSELETVIQHVLKIYEYLDPRELWKIIKLQEYLVSKGDNLSRQIVNKIRWKWTFGSMK